jgi:chorismate synthase
MSSGMRQVLLYQCAGEIITIRVAFKPTSTIGQKQKTVSRDGVDVDLIARGRHDPCVVPRAVPMVEAMVAIVLADQLLRVRVRSPARTDVLQGLSFVNSWMTMPTWA